LAPFTDFHCHVVPGVDDGVKTLDEARAAIAVLARLGFARLAVTPHIYPSVYPNDPESLCAKLEALREALAAAPDPVTQSVELRAGAEHFFGPELEALVAAGRALTWGAEGVRRRYLLMEVAHHQPFPLNLEATLFRWRVAGIFAILAHPERYAEVLRDRSRARRLVDEGVLLQVDLPSLGGKFGRDVQKLGRALVEDGLVALAASDLHAPADEAPVADGIAWLRKKGAAERLLAENPDRIWQGLHVEP
jgi:protein-tyrosine phosphatase